MDNESDDDDQRDQLATEDDNSPIKLNPTDMELGSPEASGALFNANMTENPSKKPPAELQAESQAPHPQPPIQLGPSPTHPLTPLAPLLPADTQGEVDDDGPVVSRSRRKQMPIRATDDEWRSI